MEGIKQSILLLGDQADFSDQIFHIVRDNSFHGLNIIRTEKRVEFLKYLKPNHICLIIFCIRDLSYFEQSIKKLHEYNYQGSIIPITNLDSGEVGAVANPFKCHEPIKVESINNEILLHAIFSCIEKKKIIDEIQIHDAILRSVNFAAEKFLNNPDWRTHIKEVLQNIAEASQVDRTYLYENVYSGKNLIGVRMVERWIAPGISDESITIPGDVRTFKQLGISQFIQELREIRFINADIDDLPKKIQPMFRLMRVKSLLIVSIFTNGDWWGFIGFDQCSYQRTWKKLEIEELRTASSMLSAAIMRQKTDKRIKYLATHDYLTDLPNRLLFEDHFYGAKARCQRTNKWIGLFVIDLDRFKRINDTYGHPFGDKVLVEVGRRLQSSIRASDTVARIGGDEFIIIGEEINTINDLNLVGKKILNAFTEPIICNNNKVQVSPSIGISVYPQDSEDLEELMQLADKSLYQAKKQGNTFNIYQEGAGKQLWLDNVQKY